MRGDCFGEFLGACFGGEVERGIECIDEELIAMGAKGGVRAADAWLQTHPRFRYRVEASLAVITAKK